MEGGREAASRPAWAKSRDVDVGEDRRRGPSITSIFGGPRGFRGSALGPLAAPRAWAGGPALPPETRAHLRRYTGAIRPNPRVTRRSWLGEEPTGA
eukprot:9490368-Pyramimonas_sp.AAC.1